MGVTVLAVLQLLGGLAMLVVMGSRGKVDTNEMLGLVIGAAAVALSHGTWQMRPWAWGTTLAVHALVVMLAIVDLGVRRDPVVVTLLIVSILVLGYLTTPGIRRHYHP